MIVADIYRPDQPRLEALIAEHSLAPAIAGDEALCVTPLPLSFECGAKGAQLIGRFARVASGRRRGPGAGP